MEKKRESKYRLVFLIFSISLMLQNCGISKSEKKDQSYLCSKIQIIFNYSNGQEVDGIKLEETIKYLESLTKIESEYDGSPIGLKLPSRTTLRAWITSLKKKGYVCAEFSALE